MRNLLAHTLLKRCTFILLSFTPSKRGFHTPLRQYSSLYCDILGFSSAITIAFTAWSLLKSTSYQGFFTVGLDTHELPKSSSLAKSIMAESSLQLAFAGCLLARLCDMTGASNAESLVT